MSDCRHPRFRILNSTVPIDAVKCFFNLPRVPARVSVTVLTVTEKNDLVPELIMPRLIGVSRNGLNWPRRVSSVGRALNCGAEGRGFDSRK